MEIQFQIIFSVIIITIVLSSLFYAISLFREKESENKVFSSFKNLVNDINALCLSFPYTEKQSNIIINEKTISIFFVNSIEKIDLEEILGKETSFGEFACIAYEGKRINCEKLICNASAKIIGYNESKRFFNFLETAIFGIKEYEKPIHLIRYSNNVSIE